MTCGTAGNYNKNDAVAYKFFKNGTQIQCLPTRHLKITNINLSDNGEYHCEESINGLEAVSEKTQVNVFDPATGK